jgi:HlyD family secretion protein
MNHAGRWVPFGLALTVATLGGGWLWFTLASGRDGATVLHLPGVVEVQEVRLGSKVGGRIREVLVTEGSLVEAGAALVTLEVPELMAQRAHWDAKLRSADAELAKARNGPRPQEIAAAEAALSAAEARAKRAKFGFREEEIRKARDDWGSAEADLKLTEDQFGRYERLFQKHTVAQAELDTARANYDRARGKAAAARAHYDMMNSGNRPEDIAEAEALSAEARANLNLLKAGTRPEEIARLEGNVAEIRARLQETDVHLDEATVRAPSRSIVDVVSVRKGDLVAAGQTIVRILQADDMWVRVYIPEIDLGKVRLNQAARVTVDAYSDLAFEGKVIQISTVSEFTPRNVQSVEERSHQVFGAKVRIDDPKGVFKSGMAAEVDIAVGGAR